MKFRFKIQEYQTDAVDNTVAVFEGQPKIDNHTYRRDLGKRTQMTTEDDTGYNNHELELPQADILKNIQKIQSGSDIPNSGRLVKLSKELDVLALDIEMETGTGKTYVYIKTMYELNKRYGWNKFIVVVPSIAIREGVKKSFEMLEGHFMEQYGKKVRYFVYNSSNLQLIDSYSSDASINVMIINVQAFNTSMKEGASNKESRIIYSKRDEFQSRRPIDVIAANRPILIMDEPQKMEGKGTQTGLKNFDPLFVLNYSATHKTKHNCVYSLDALDAYKKKLVKKIQVKGITLKNLKGTSGYIYFDSIILSKNHAPVVRLEIEVKGTNSMRREIHKFEHGDSLKAVANLNVYEGYTISEINPYTNTVTFLNGEKIRRGEVVGDVTESTIQRVQVRETIQSHFEKERQLFKRGIKTLSLFFIDEVANYKSYDETGEVVHGDLWKIFEDEYVKYLNENISLFEDDYQKYLKRFNVSQVHNGYFSIDKKGHAVNSEVKRGEEFSSDISAYDLILKNKERLLSFDEPTRFIFSHSALREGWDNPNVFQICTLRHSNSDVGRRQEVGRGLRICVDKNGNRMDYEMLGDAVHEVNKLTVIANENYSDFVEALQNETRDTLRDRPQKATADYFENKIIEVEGEKRAITANESASIVSWLYDNDYIDENGTITTAYKDDLLANTLAPMSKKLAPLGEGVKTLIQGLFDPSILKDMIENNFGTANIQNNQLNDNASKKEFKALWNEIHNKYVYTVHYDSDELVKNAIKAIDDELNVSVLRYTVTTGNQGDEELDFTGDTSTRTRLITDVYSSTAKYDLVGEIAKGATLTRRSVVKILNGISKEKLMKFRNNPEEFIHNVVRLIKEQKSTMIVDHISYNKTEDVYDMDIFTQDTTEYNCDEVYAAKKHILDYVVTDSEIETTLAKDMDAAEEVCVYAKLPRSFQIPTPVGNYAPDWAIAFNDNCGIKHIFFVAETKGSVSSMDLRPIETNKIACAKKLFNNISSDKVRYDVVKNFDTLLNEIKDIK